MARWRPEGGKALAADIIIALSSNPPPSHPNHPADGDSVAISDVVVTGIRASGGFFVQDPAAAEYGGLYVYDRGATTVALGDVVSVVGTYTEYFGLTEITDPTVTPTGSAAVPDPIEVDPCDVATGGARAEPLEGMLVVVRDVALTDANPDGTADYDEFEVGGCLRVDDFLWDALDQPASGAWSSITGVALYSFDNAKIAPRAASDMAE